MSCFTNPRLCPSPGDLEINLLAKILQSLNASGGGGGGGVTSVNGDPGPAVLLDSGEIPEGANLYYTAARFNTAFAAKSTTDLAEGANLYFTAARVRATDLTGFASALGAITAADTVLTAFGKAQGRLAALEGGTGPFVLKTGDTMTGALTIAQATANATPLVISGYSLTAANAQSGISLDGTWNTAGAPMALHVNIVNTASGATSQLFDFQLDGTSVLNLRVDGRLTLTGRAAFVASSVLGHGLRTLDTDTAAANPVLTIAHNTTTAGANGIGAIFDWNLHSTTTSDTRAARWTVLWTDATHATRTSTTSFTNLTAGAEAIQLLLGAGQVQGTDGTALLPTFTSRNDTNTGMYFSNPDQISWATGGVQREVLSNTGLQVVVPLTVSSTNTQTVGITSTLTGASTQTSLQIFPTWNTSGAPTVFAIDLSDTASAATSAFIKCGLLFGATLFSVTKAGLVTAAAGLVASTVGLTITSGKLQTAIAALTDGANIATDAALANQFRVTLAGNRTLDTPTNPYDGARVVWEFLQDGTGNRTITLSAGFSFGTDITGVTLSTAAGARDYMTAIYQATAAKWQVVAFVKGYV
jgi:hypothetical protein